MLSISELMSQRVRQFFVRGQAMPGFMVRYPELAIDIDFSDALVDLVRTGIFVLLNSTQFQHRV